TLEPASVGGRDSRRGVGCRLLGPRRRSLVRPQRARLPASARRPRRAAGLLQALGGDERGLQRQIPRRERLMALDQRLLEALTVLRPPTGPRMERDLIYR